LCKKSIRILLYKNTKVIKVKIIYYINIIINITNYFYQLKLSPYIRGKFKDFNNFID